MVDGSERRSRRDFLKSAGALGIAAWAGTAGTTRAAATSRLPRIEAGVTASGISGLAARVVEDLGLDRAHGLDVHFVAVGVAQAEQGLVQQRYPVAMFSPIAAVRADAEGIPIRLFAPFFFNHNSVMVRAGSPYRQLEDLKGKRVGCLSKITGTFNSFMALCALKGLGDPERYFQLRFGEVPALIAFLDRGDVEAIVIFEAHVSRLLGTGNYRELVRLNDAFLQLTGQSNLFIAMAAHEQWLKEHQEEALRFRRMLAAAIDYIQANPETVIRRYGKEIFALETDRHFQLAIQRMPGFYTKQWDEALVVAQERQMQPMIASGLLPPNSDVRKVFWLNA